ncbi:tyrosine-type recombinase/integrase [Aerococcus urinae]|uniref:Site-specific integrase n=2 Tax=Aerococcus TaxID=1375 RepID=A0A1E9PLJ6_9LACT|nr:MULTISPECIES: tyrosine-type recombinase/integrase [Aerococcus]KAA9291990.1 site-specific integrase [Aerococcus mictus]MBU5610182.1 site-specific integrase [Aerococcus urinae]MCY3034908.1 site-specific integrase [Aerococcus mictus]MCY3063362.1 site-specific integrase [Aerococcus mictus]MCY3066036.1 site-specific integrase [Aerococcus mictus]
MATYKQYSNSKGKFWEVKAYLGLDEETGKQVQISKRGFKTKKQAVDYYKQRQNLFDSDLDLQNNSLNVEQLYHEWLDQYKLDVQKSTLRVTMTNFKLHILPSLGKIKIDKLKTRTIQNLVNEWHKRYKKHKEIFNLLKRLMKYAVTMDYIFTNPCDKVIIPKKKIEYYSPSRDRDFYNKDELEEFLRILEKSNKPMWYCFFRILAFTGLRRGEALALTWNDINFKESTLSVNKSLSRGNDGLYIGRPKNESSIRTIGIDQNTLSVIHQWKKKQAQEFLKLGQNLLSSDQFLFRKADINFPINQSAPRNFLYRFCKSNELPMINIHGFRHTHCSLLFESGVPIKEVMERLGHADIQTTMNIYTHVTPQSREKSANKFAKYVNF